MWRGASGGQEVLWRKVGRGEGGHQVWSTRLGASPCQRALPQRAVFRTGTLGRALSCSRFAPSRCEVLTAQHKEAAAWLMRWFESLHDEARVATRTTSGIGRLTTRTCARWTRESIT